MGVKVRLTRENYTQHFPSYWQSLSYSRTLIEGLLDSLPDLFATNTVVEAAMGGPLKASLIALKRIGGQLNIFQTRLPTVGPGALKHRDETKFQGTDKEKTLFIPQDPSQASSLMLPV
jgi:protein transport protein SEC24